MEFYLGHEDISRGTIRELKCRNCNFNCDSFSIIGDTEAMNFLGVIGITNLSTKEIFITHLTKDEFQQYKSTDSKKIVNRMKELLNRNNLAFLKKKTNAHGKLFIPCLKCDFEMSTMNEISLEEYTDRGGKVYTIGNYPND